MSEPRSLTLLEQSTLRCLTAEAEVFRMRFAEKMREAEGFVRQMGLPEGCTVTRSEAGEFVVVPPKAVAEPKKGKKG